MRKKDYLSVPPPSSLPYRACVGIALFNRERKVFVGERLDNPGAWQLPQGGIDEGETVEKAFFREMLEEIGTDNAEIIKIHDEVLRYDLPPHLLGRLWGGRYAGQEQTWVAGLFRGDDREINIFHDRNPEFSAWRWVPLDDVLSMVVPFKRDTYKKVIDSFRDLTIEI